MSATNIDTSQLINSSKLHNSRLSELRDSLIQNRTKAKTKTKTEGKSELPQISFTTEASSIKKQQNLLSSENRHLRYLFHEFCKQSYVGGAQATFDQISQSAEFMTLNKWMVFCKEFHLTKSLSNREAIQIFKTATEERSSMTLPEFCKAVEMVQQKSKMEPEHFATNILHVDSHQSARNRLCVMKVHFSGPKTNFFINSQFTEKQRKEEKMAQEAYKQKQLEKSYILHQGMFKEHIELSLYERKKLRSERTEKLKNRSEVQNYSTSGSPISEKRQFQTQRYKKQPLIFISPKTRKSKTVFENYSKIFSTKKAINQNNSFAMKNPSNVNNQQNPMQSSQSQSRIMYQQKKYNGNLSRIADFNQQQQKWEIDSGAQSDDILKEHYENEKRIKSKIHDVQGMKMDNKNIDKQKIVETHKDKYDEQAQQKQKQKQEDDDMMITRYN